MKEDTTPIDPTWMERTGGYARDKTLRDEFAELAMQGRLANGATSAEITSQKAYEFADAMLKERNK